MSAEQSTIFHELYNTKHLACFDKTMTLLACLMFTAVMSTQIYFINKYDTL